MFSGTRLTGESGDDDGEGSERGEESVVDKVVVGEESADSDIWVELLSLCLWDGSEGTAPCLSGCDGFANNAGCLESPSTSL